MAVVTQDEINNVYALSKELATNNRLIAVNKAEAKKIIDANKAFAERNVVILDELNVRTEGDKVRIGLSDYAQDQLGDIVFVELPQLGDSFEKGEEFAKRTFEEAQKEAADVLGVYIIPMAGVIQLKSAI